MRNGMTISGNRDQMYVGHKYRYTGSNPQGNETADASDPVVQWADTLTPPAGVARDNMRFIFTTSPDQVGLPATGARSIEGLELMRLHPADSAGQIVPRIGLGDYYRQGVLGGVDPLPSERFDILNGRMRHRQLPTDAEMTAASKAMVVDANGIVGWRPYNTLGTDCKWDWDPPTGRIYTAWLGDGTNGTCPEEDWRIGIGTVVLPAKLNVKGRSPFTSGAITGDYFITGTAGGAAINATVQHESGGVISGDVHGVYATVLDVGAKGHAMRGDLTAKGSGTLEAHGVTGRVTLSSGSSTAEAYGLRSTVEAVEGSSASKVFGMKTLVFGTGTMTDIVGMASVVEPTGSGVSSSFGISASSDWSGSGTVTFNKGADVKAMGTGTVTNSIDLDASAAEGTAMSIGARSTASGLANTPIVTGMHGETTGPALFSKGVYGFSNTNATGLPTFKFGAFGKVRVGSTSNSDTLTTNASIFGDFPGTASRHWAGFFEEKIGVVGTVFANQTAILSDGSLKTDVQAMTDQNAGLMSVQGHVYQFTDEAKERLRLPEGQQIGFIAQEVEEFFPQLVLPYTVMARFDSLGNITAPEVQLKAVNYNGFVPLLVSGHQQQENRLAAVESQLAEVLEQLAACCANADGTRALASGDLPGAALENDLRVVPNPVADRTELRYTVASEGRVRLEITDTNSRVVLTREEGQRTTGSFVYEWDTTLLAPGTYICTLYINDEFLVKKSVKLGQR